MHDEMLQIQFKINLFQYLNSLPGRYVGDVEVKLHSHAEAIDGSNWPALCSTFLSPGDRAGIQLVKPTAIFKMVRLFFKLSQNREKQEYMVKLLAYLAVCFTPQNGGSSSSADGVLFLNPKLFSPIICVHI
jgi:hypothetical protein